MDSELADKVARALDRFSRLEADAIALALNEVAAGFSGTPFELLVANAGAVCKRKITQKFKTELKRCQWLGVVGATSRCTNEGFPSVL